MFGHFHAEHIVACSDLPPLDGSKRPTFNRDYFPLHHFAMCCWDVNSSQSAMERLSTENTSLCSRCSSRTNNMVGWICTTLAHNQTLSEFNCVLQNWFDFWHFFILHLLPFPPELPLLIAGECECVALSFGSIWGAWEDNKRGSVT